MKRKDLLEFEIRKKLVESLVQTTEQEIAVAETSMLNILNSTSRNGVPLPKDEIERDLKPILEEYTNLQKRAILFRGEYERLNSDKRRALLKRYVPKELEYKITKFFVDKWIRDNPGKTKENAFFVEAERLGKEVEAVKRSYYYKLNELQK